MTEQNKPPEKASPTGEVDPARQQRIISYNKAVRLAEIATVALSEIKFKVNRENSPQPDEAGKLKPAYNGRLVNVAFDEEKGFLLVSVEWIVEIKSGRKQFSKCTAVYDVIYRGLKGFDRDIVNLYADNVARPTSYAYFRALYANIDWSAGLMSPPLPIIKLQPRVS